jgi:hypothetical protein
MNSKSKIDNGAAVKGGQHGMTQQPLQGSRSVKDRLTTLEAGLDVCDVQTAGEVHPQSEPSLAQQFNMLAA